MIQLFLVLFSLLSFAMATPQSGDDLLKRANNYYKAAEFQKAIILYQKAQKRGADVYNSSFNIGNCYFQLGDLPKAAGAYRKAVRYGNSESNSAIFNLAAVLFRLNQYAESIALYHRGLEKDPVNLSAWLYLSEAYTRMGELIGAQKALEKAKSLEEGDVTIIYQLAEIHVALKEVDQAVTLVRKSYEINPKETDFLFYIGDLYRLDGQLEKAATAYREGLSVEPENAEVHYKLADVLTESKQFYLAMEHLQKVLLIQPENVDAAVFLGNLAYDLKWWDRSAEAYLLAVQKNNVEGVQGILNLAFEFEAKKNYSGAKELAALLEPVQWAELGQKAEWIQLKNRLENSF